MPATDLPTLSDRWSRVLTERGGCVAITDCVSNTTHTFADIETLAQNIEQELRALLPQTQTGNTPIVVLGLPNGTRWLSAYLAIHRCGAVIAPVEPGTGSHYAHPECLRNAVARIDASGITAQGVAAINKHADDTTGTQETTNDSDNSKRDIADTKGGSKFTVLPADAMRQPHLIKLTSGSTGQPQALCFTEANMVADGLNIIATMGLRADSINYAAIPFGHSYGLGNLVLPFFLQGTAIVCASGILPNIVAAEIATSRATFFAAVPTLIRALCTAQADAQKLVSLETIISAGSVLPADLARQFRTQYGKRVQNFYGSSETGGICFDTSGEATLSGQSVGTALANVQIDTDEQGCVRVRSDAVCTDLADALQRVVLADKATLLANGELRLEGRGGRMLKIGARRLDLGAWEAQARTVDAIDDVFACGGTRPGGESMLCAAVQTLLPASALRETFSRHFPRWQQPARLLCLPAFPQTARGKTDTAALRALLEQRCCE